MPSEPIEAEFVFPFALSQAQEDGFRHLEQEGPLSHTSNSTVVATPSLPDHETALEKNAVRIVSFDHGAGEDPREWSKLRKWYSVYLITGTTAFLCLSVSLGSSIITGDMSSPAQALNTTQEVVNLTVTCFVIGFGIGCVKYHYCLQEPTDLSRNGPLFFVPLSEVVGRKPMYCIGIFLYFILTLPAALAKNVATLVISRQIAGIASSAPLCNVGRSIADIWRVEERGLPMAIFSTTIFLGRCVGPLIGGWIGQRAGWRWIYWVLFIFLGFCFILTLLIPETLAPVLLRRKAEKLRKDTGDESYKTLEELERLPIKETLKIALVRPLAMLISEPIVLFMSFYLSFVYSLPYLLFFAFPIAFEEIRGFSPGMTGVTFISIMIGNLLALGLMPFQERIYHKVTADGTFPEARLYPMMLGAVVLPVALFIFAFTDAYSHVNFMGPCVAGALFGFAMILLYVAANSYIVDSYSSFAASAIAAKTLMRSEFGAMIPLFVVQMFHGMSFQYAGLLLALIACAIGPMPFVFYRYGGKIRSQSSRATTAIRGQRYVGEKVDIGH